MCAKEKRPSASALHATRQLRRETLGRASVCVPVKMRCSVTSRSSAPTSGSGQLHRARRPCQGRWGDDLLGRFLIVGSCPREHFVEVKGFGSPKPQTLKPGVAWPGITFSGWDPTNQPEEVSPHSIKHLSCTHVSN